MSASSVPPIPIQPRTVSVVVPTCNRPQLLRGALASIRAIEGPDLAFEIIIGDNGDLPENRAIAEEFGAKYSHTATQGAAAARNAALRKATGEFIAFLDDDDEWLPTHIRPHIALLDGDCELQAVFGQMQLTDENLRPYDPPWPIDAPDTEDGMFLKMMNDYFPQLGATVVRGDIVSKVGFMDEALMGSQDWDWQLRIAGGGRVGFVQTPCVLFRQRAHGSFDKLQTARVGYTRKVFLRHALPNWKRWRSPLEMARAFFSVQNHYFLYFAGAALDRARARDRLGAMRALWHGFWVFPTRAARSLFRQSQYRNAVIALLSPADVQRTKPLH